MVNQDTATGLIPLESGRRVKRIEMVEVKSVLTQQPSHDATIPFGYTINPYRGCIFGCSYCYASKFVFEDAAKKSDWGWWVEVKENAVAVLQKESHKLTGASIFLGSATDPYQPVELRVGLTRALLEVLLFAFPARVHIQTRSPFVTRDIDLLQKFGDTLTVGVSIPTDSEIVRKAFEPRAPSIPHRLEAALKLKEAGIQTIASVAPLLPCTPKRLAHLLAPRVHTAWVGSLQFYEKADTLREIFASRKWDRYLGAAHRENVRAALAEVLVVH